MPKDTLAAVCDAVEAHGWSLFVIEPDGSHAWFAIDGETDAEMEEWNALADKTLADVQERFPDFVFRTNDEYGNCEEPAIGTVYIDIYSRDEAAGRGLFVPANRPAV